MSVRDKRSIQRAAELSGWLNPAPNASSHERNCQPRINPLVCRHPMHDHYERHVCPPCLTSEIGATWDSGKMPQLYAAEHKVLGLDTKCIATNFLSKEISKILPGQIKSPRIYLVIDNFSQITKIDEICNQIYIEL